MSPRTTKADFPRANISICIVLTVLLSPIAIKAQKTATASVDDSNVRPPVTSADLKIVQRAREILDSPSKWNRADNRECPAGAKTFSLYCALEMATTEISGKAEHRGAALQEARFVIDEITVNRNYNHRLMDYNNDPTTSFSDIQEVLRAVNLLFTMRLKAEGVKVAASVTPAPASASGGSSPAVTRADIEIARRARQILDSPSKWNRDRTQVCPADAKTFNLFCALAKASIEVTGAFDEVGAALRETRHAIDETAPNAKSYKARLVDYNNDPTTTLADIQKLLQLVEERLTKRLAENAK